MDTVTDVLIGGEVYGTASYYDMAPGLLVFHDFRPKEPPMIAAHRLSLNFVTGEILFKDEANTILKRMEFDLKLVEPQ